MPAPERTDVALSSLTTLRLGGPARRLVEVHSTDDLATAVTELDAGGEPVLLLGGGSNVVIADDGFEGTVVLLRSSGVRVQKADGAIELDVAAGEGWDDLVTRTVAEGWVGLECLAGIPGLVGATPIQNVGAYGAEVADVVTGVEVLDRGTGQRLLLDPADCAFGYRTSVFKREDRWVVLAVRFRLRPGELGSPLRYAELAGAVGRGLGEAAPPAEVREAVLALRRRKGMVLDPADPDTASAGSFFTNPVLAADDFRALCDKVAVRCGATVTPPRYPAGEGPAGQGSVKTSAAWLIERAGFGRGFALSPEARARVSSKHTLALTNAGGATTAELLALARVLRDGVRDAFGVDLRPEPRLVGVPW